MTRASVVIPCHNKATTLVLVVDSVLRQTVQDLEVIMLGDGVTDEVRTAIEALCAADGRVRFLDFPKGPHHGEAYRHDAVLAARSDAIFYLCDDDLLLPEHVSDLLALLEKANVVQSLGGYIRPDGTFGSYAGDLADPAQVAAILDEAIRFNFVSITGTAHSKDFYLEAGARWETTPEGVWPDHHQFRRLARQPGYRGATSDRMTALQLPTTNDGREEWTAEERLEELARWHEVVVAIDGQHQIDAVYHQGLVGEVARSRLLEVQQALQIEHLLTTVAERDQRIDDFRVIEARLQANLDKSRRRRRALRGELDALRAQSAKPWWRRWT